LFIENDSQLQINIDHILRLRVLNDFANNSFEGLFVAQRTIFVIMRDDAFLRFLQSKEIEDYIATKDAIIQNLEL